jgi:hypothetical protein
MSAGKGDTPRPVDGDRYRRNYEAIFLKPYPDWICDECGRLHGKRPEGNPYGATYHFGTCDLCGHSTDVTEPRDWGHLRDSWQTQKHGLQPQKKTPKNP